MRKALALFAFLVRLYNFDNCVIEEAEARLQRTELQSLANLHKLFYQMYCQGFCSDERGLYPTINAHTFFHLFEIRRRLGQPLHHFSTEDYESIYAVLRRCYRAGTPNVPKQIMENFYLRER